MTKLSRDTTEKELWEHVATHLARHGIDTVLVGGGVVSIYTDGEHRSGDLDFVVTNLIAKKVPALMKELGFVQDRQRPYAHPDCPHILVDFVAPPLGIGDDHRIQPDERSVRSTTIRILSPTDSIRDRLASYSYQDARECLEHAAMVAERHAFDLEKVEAWCRQERLEETFAEFLARLEARRRPRR